VTASVATTQALWWQRYESKEWENQVACADLPAAAAAEEEVKNSMNCGSYGGEVFSAECFSQSGRGPAASQHSSKGMIRRVFGMRRIGTKWGLDTVKPSVHALGIEARAGRIWTSHLKTPL
jgi:hypothetical protein